MSSLYELIARMQTSELTTIDRTSQDDRAKREELRKQVDPLGLSLSQVNQLEEDRINDAMQLLDQENNRMAKEVADTVKAKEAAAQQEPMAGFPPPPTT